MSMTLTEAPAEFITMARGGVPAAKAGLAARAKGRSERAVRRVIMRPV